VNEMGTKLRKIPDKSGFGKKGKREKRKNNVVRDSVI